MILELSVLTVMVSENKSADYRQGFCPDGCGMFSNSETGLLGCRAMFCLCRVMMKTGCICAGEDKKLECLCRWQGAFSGRSQQQPRLIKTAKAAALGLRQIFWQMFPVELHAGLTTRRFLNV
jgi:hypothetical protein